MPSPSINAIYRDGQVMRRRLRTTLLIAAPLMLAALPAVAEEIVSIVTGLAPGDLLNVRAAPSAIGKTEARLAGGARLKNFGCNDVNGNPWCKVEDLDHPEVSGWAPARYLIPTNPATVPEAALPQANAAAAPAAASNDAGQPDQPQKTAATEAESGASAAPAEAAPAAPQPLPAAPLPDLSARLGGPEPKSAASIGSTAMQDAYGLAFAAAGNPSTGEIAAAAEQDPAAAPDTGTAPVAAGIPVPTPRPGAAETATAAEPQIVARAEPTGTSAADATNEIPCARYVGQPMTLCRASILRTGADKADITVMWPDGGSRVISFYAGLPAGSNARSDFRFTREGSLSMIRIGVSERFEITDALALGD